MWIVHAIKRGAESKMRKLMQIISAFLGPFAPLTLVMLRELVKKPRVLALATIHTFRNHGASVLGSTKLLEDLHYSLRGGRYEVTKLYLDWKKTEFLFSIGEYHKAITMRKEIMSDLNSGSKEYESLKYPPIIPQSFTVSIGHLALLFLHKISVQRELLPQGPRTHVVGSSCSNVDAFRFLTREESVVFSDGLSILGTTFFSPICENLVIFRGNEEFYDIYELWEKVGRLLKEDLDAGEKWIMDYQTSNKQAHRGNKIVLEGLGVTEEDKIAVLHVRDSGNGRDVRNSEAANYIGSIKELINKDFKVFRIGDAKMPPLSFTHDNFIDLTTMRLPEEISHIYLISLCDLFLGTTSGPLGWPLLFGKPTLGTNITGLSRNTLFGKKAMYLPKMLWDTKSKRFLTIEEMLHHRVSFGGEYSHSQLQKHGLKFVENTEEELTSATKDLLSEVESGFMNISMQMNRINQIRKEAKSVSTGNFSKSFIERVM